MYLDGHPAATDPQRTLDTLAARAEVGVFLDIGEETYVAEPGSPSADRAEEPAEAVEDPADGREVYVVGGVLPLEPDRRAELSLQLGGAVTAVPCGDRTIVVPSAGGSPAPWRAAQRPVLALRRDADSLQLQLFTAAALQALPRRGRLASMALPDWVAVWREAPEPILTQPSAGRDLQSALWPRLFDADLPSFESLVEAGIEGTALLRVLGAPLSATSIDAIVAALGLDSVVADLIADRVEPETLPGAVKIEERGVWGTIAAAMTAEPVGDGRWRRWRRIPHRRPVLAVFLILAELAIAGSLLAAALVLPLPQPSTVLLWIGAVFFGVDAVADSVLLAAVRARKKHRPAVRR